VVVGQRITGTVPSCGRSSPMTSKDYCPGSGRHLVDVDQANTVRTTSTTATAGYDCQHPDVRRGHGFYAEACGEDSQDPWQQRRDDPPNCVHESWISPNIPNGLTVATRVHRSISRMDTERLRGHSQVHRGIPANRTHSMGGNYLGQARRYSRWNTAWRRWTFGLAGTFGTK
jgi:hypothetical protein